MRTGNPTLVSLALYTGEDFQENLNVLVKQCEQISENSIIVAPEVSVTGFCYEHFAHAALFASNIDEALLKASKNHKTLITTYIEEEANYFYNVAKVYHDGKIIHQQRKHKLFPLGNEDLHFTAGHKEAIQLFKIDGI
ncbi:MAG: carbon-nitrogen hydrolase family protein, partial [Thiovulaceae bacterium]|nr:carbon-nitrogen hydrolase family protein [Sulfurimonadaceae bacterium]